MALKPGRGALAVGLVLSTMGACRSVSLCHEPACEIDASPPPAGGTASGAAGEGSIDAAGGQGGEGGATDGGQPAAEQSSAGAGGTDDDEPLVCEIGRGDCDASRLTGCETNLEVSARHCGRCGHSCEGACDGGECLQTLLVQRDVAARSFVVTQTFGFTVLERREDETSVVRIGLSSGEVESVLGNVSKGTELMLGADRVYAFDAQREIVAGAKGALHSFALDGSDPELEALDPPPLYAGASGEGVYYLDSSRLWFRAQAAATWKQLWGGESGRLLASGFGGVVFEHPDAQKKPHLYLLRGATIVDYGVAPANLRDARLVTDLGRSWIACITGDGEDTPRVLWWMSEDSTATTHYEVAAGFGNYGAFEMVGMQAHLGQLALMHFDYKSVYVQLFAPDGPSVERIGLPDYSQLALLSEHHIWFSVMDDWVHWRFLRASYAD